MPFLADEDFPGPIFRTLRSAGFDIARAQDAGAGRADDVVLAQALAEQRILLTRDLGFGERVIREGLPTYGVVLVRLRGAATWHERSARVLSVLHSANDFRDAVTTIDWTSTRRRTVP
jgi:predicted nuclease of predicted toxin-antitoxin system